MKLFLALLLFVSAPALAGTSFTIDVRTPEEFRDGHLKGARNIDVLASGFDAEISRLDKKAAYKLYCRSGKRSGKALEVMRAKGFTSLENLGSLQEALAKLKADCEGKGC